MAGIEQLGRAFNLATSATTAKTRVNLKNAAGVGIVLIGATSGAATIYNYTAASGGTETALATTTRYYTQASGLWTKVTQAAGSTVTAATGGLLYVYVSATSLADGYQWVSASHASGSFVFIVGDLAVQRAAANLVAVTA
jgi:hypothetical protein